MGVVGSAGVFLVSSLAGFVLFALVMRLFLELAAVRVMHPLFDTICQLTNPGIDVFRRFVFSAQKTSTIVIGLLITVELAKCLLVYTLQFGFSPSLLTLIVMAFSEGLSLMLNLSFYALFAYVLLSWVPSIQASPVAAMIRMVALPILKPFQRMSPASNSGIDFAPMLAILTIHLLDIVLVAPLSQWVLS